ncbi:hypothetical protein Malapachy_3043 [Malassezia pachydermatis]|uniref:Alpha beta-hydrolase n=1 Tax=Malassezia pachydermatis TaxID=77020 RepID=A0A0M9VQX9_9BASI|nr:hypothetical protein Malapachy_3043 [Malassezia pachydermatis]KOS15993.1 hypothetical protein Malapachy_3043 [Malassezia pachydermatis]
MLRWFGLFTLCLWCCTQLAWAQGTMLEQVRVSELSRSDPIGAAKQVIQFPHILRENASLWFQNNNVSGTGDDAQVPWGRGAWFSWNPWALGEFETGYVWVPTDFDMFHLDRSESIGKINGTEGKIPYYVNKDYDASKIKRAVIIWPGQWRDSWKFINLLGNAYRVAQKYPELEVHDGEVLMISPLFLNEDDMSAGAATKDQLVFAKSGWSAGGTARSPEVFKHVSSFDVIDHFVNKTLNKDHFPNLETTVVAGHSMGGQAALHYAMLKNPTSDEDRVRIWVGNPGSYVWLDDSRPFSTKGCDGYTNWPYGVSDIKTIPKYARSRAGENGATLIRNFRERHIHFAISENDNGQGVTHCEAMAQGPNRIARGTEWVLAQGNSTAGWSDKHTLNYIAGASHQDYVTMAYYYSLKHIFSDNN